MITPTVDPIVLHLPSLGHRRCCVAGLTRGTPDSSEAAIMGVPLPHLVLPLSGCLSRRTPTRATRGEARGHRSVLAQNSLLMYPSLFLPSDRSSVWCVLAIWWIGPNVFALLWLHSCLVLYDGVTLWTCGSPKGTQHDDPGSVCCLCIASRCGCRPASGMSTPSRCRALVHSRCQWCRDRLGHIGSARLCVCVSIAVVGPTMVTPEDRGGLGG